MKIVKFCLCLSVFVFCVCFSGSAFAANKVYPLNHLYGIVADDLEWICEISDKGDEALGISKGQKSIKGKAKYLPITFEFFYRYINWYSRHNTAPLFRPNSINVFSDAKIFLSNYALKSSTIFSSLNIKISDGNDFLVVIGNYFDNQSSGRFAFYIKPEDINKNPPNDHCCCMFIKIPGELLDDQAIEHLFQETFNLITPLIIE